DVPVIPERAGLVIEAQDRSFRVGHNRVEELTVEPVRVGRIEPWRTGHDAAPDTEEDPETVGEAGLDLVGSERIFQASGLDTGDQGEERADRDVWAVLDVVLQHVRRIPRLDHAVE